MNLATASNSTSVQTTIDTSGDDYIISFSDVTVNLDRGTVVRGSKKVTLTAAELELLTFFCAESGPGTDPGYDSRFRVELPGFAEYADGGRSCAAAAPKTGSGTGFAALLCDGPQGRLSLFAQRYDNRSHTT